jgi:hypothetical protein
MQFGARFYLPKLGRFTSADTIVPNFANPQSLNRYAFVLNNPLRFTDPSGHDPIPDQGLEDAPTCSNVTCISGDAVLDDGLSMGGGLGNCGCTGTGPAAAPQTQADAYLIPVYSADTGIYVPGNGYRTINYNEEVGEQIPYYS